MERAARSSESATGKMMLTTYRPHYAIINAATLAPRTKENYCIALDNMIKAGVSPKNILALEVYANGRPLSERRNLKAALRILVRYERLKLKSSVNPETATPESMAQLDARMYNLDAINEAIHAKDEKGTRSHIWLTAPQVEQITALPDSSLEGKRDWILLGVLLGAGLRREELSTLTFDSLKQQPNKNGLRDVLQVKGKGSKTRVIPISPKLASRLREWKAITGGGNVARAIKWGKLEESLSSGGISLIVHAYGSRIGLPELACHDCRRSYAMLGLNAGIPITQISVLLGHDSIETTQRYLSLEIDFDETISDHVPLSGD